MAGPPGWSVKPWRRRLERRRPPSRGPRRAKNVILIVLDTVRAQSLSLYGYGRKTSPNLERIAAEGARFDQALATAPGRPLRTQACSRVNCPQLSIGWDQPLDGTYPTLAEFLERAATARPGSWPTPPIAAMRPVSTGVFATTKTTMSRYPTSSSARA